MTTKNNNIIVWQKWFDPFGRDEEYSDWSEDYEDMEKGEEKFDHLPINANAVRAISTPMGIVPYTDNTASSKIFNFWIGHTNFSISQKIANVIESVDGVETLDIFTRYRFRIAIGKAFDASEVMTNINDIVYAYLE